MYSVCISCPSISSLFTGLKVPAPHMECQLFQFYSFIAQCVQYAWGEMQSRCGGSHRTFDFGVDSLVSLLVTFLGLPVQVGGWAIHRRPREMSAKSLPIIPAKFIQWLVPAFTPFGVRVSDLLSRSSHVSACLPSIFEVADHAEPGGMLGLLEVEGVVVRQRVPGRILQSVLPVSFRKCRRAWMTLVLLNIIRLPDGRYSGSEVNLSSETSPWRYNNSLDWSRTDNGNFAMRSSGNG